MTCEAATLLVVDDNDANRCTLTNRLKPQGYRDVVTDNDSRQALECSVHARSTSCSSTS